MHRIPNYALLLASGAYAYFVMVPRILPMSNSRIFSLSAQEVLDSRGNPTVFCKVSTKDGITGWSAVPSGASTGTYEAVELRDKDPHRFQGKGVQHAVYNIETEIAEMLYGQSILNQKYIDELLIALDRTPNKSRLGANALLAVSMAVARCAAAFLHKPLYLYLRSVYWQDQSDWVIPVPMLNVLNGGKHAPGSVDMQEFMIVPHGAVTFSEGLRWGADTYHILKSILHADGHFLGVGDEGGYMPKLSSHKQSLDLLMLAISKAGYEPGRHISLALDPAANEFFHDGAYHLKTEGEVLSSDELIALYRAWSSRYPLVSLEDGLAEDDWDGFTSLTRQLGDTIEIVGDDLFTTNIERIQQGIEKNAATAVLIKLNQIGTVSETAHAINLAHGNGMKTIISHRSGETEDTFIADLAVACNTGHIKSGAPARTERVAKYNRLLVIENELARQSIYGTREH